MAEFTEREAEPSRVDDLRHNAEECEEDGLGLVFERVLD